MIRQRFLIDPIAQLRFTLVVGCVACGAVVTTLIVACAVVIGPASNDLRRSSEFTRKGSEALTGLVAISTNGHLPADQRMSLVRSESMELASSVAESGRLAGSAADRLGNPLGYLAGAIAAGVLAGACGLLWSRRIASAEHGLTRRLEAIVDGDLRVDVPCGPYADLHGLQRGMRRALDEMRSVTRRDMQLMNEVGESVRNICIAVSAEAGLSSTSRAQLLAAAEKIGELRRIADRPRW